MTEERSPRAVRVMSATEEHLETCLEWERENPCQDRLSDARSASERLKMAVDHVYCRFRVISRAINGRPARVAKNEAIFRFLLEGMTWAVLFRVGGMAGTFASAILLARLLGVEGYGLFQYVNAWIVLMGVFSALGLPQVVTRETAAARARKAWSEVLGLRRFALGTAVAAGLLCGAVGVGIWWMIEGGRGLHVFMIGAALLPLQSIVGNLGAVQQGYERIPSAGLPSLLRDGGFAILLFLVWILPVSLNTPAEAMEIRLGASLAAVVLGVYFQKLLDREQHQTPRDVKPVYRTKFWLGAALPLIFLTGASNLNANADILMVGALMGPEAVGPYHAATRGALLITFGLTALLVPLGPVVARLHAAGDRGLLEHTVAVATRRVFVVTLPLALALTAGSKSFLEIFGPAFIEAQMALVILIIGQVVNVGAGPVQMLLVMSGHERIATAGVAMSTLVNIGLNVALIPVWGLAGAATATAVSLVLWNLLLFWQVRKRLTISIWKVPQC